MINDVDDIYRDIISPKIDKSGKSSFIKAIALNALLAQTLGIAAAQKADLTPFTRIITYITIADDISNDESMFVAELLRAKKCLATLSALEGNGFSLTIVDDSLFKSTDFEHGQAAAYKFVKDLGAFGSNITLVATHFEALTQLEQATGGLFKNYQMQIQTDATGQKQSSFQLKPGCSPRESVFDIISSGVNAPDYTASFLQ
jgi:DNA mismatch repair ATPase MutS